MLNPTVCAMKNEGTYRGAQGTTPVTTACPQDRWGSKKKIELSWKVRVITKKKPCLSKMRDRGCWWYPVVCINSIWSRVKHDRYCNHHYTCYCCTSTLTGIIFEFFFRCDNSVVGTTAVVYTRHRIIGAFKENKIETTWYSSISSIIQSMLCSARGVRFLPSSS